MFAVSIRRTRLEMAIKGLVALLVAVVPAGEGSWSISRGDIPGAVEMHLGRVAVFGWGGRDVEGITVG